MSLTEFIQIYVEKLPTWLPALLSAIPFTIQLTLVSFVVANAFGLALALAKQSRWKAVRVAATGYIEIMRGIPVLVMLYVVYFSLPELGISFGAFTAAVVAFGAYLAAQLAEVYRAGIRAVQIGQIEAGLSVGLRRRWVQGLIVLPQAVAIVIPALTNTLSALLKDTSLASIIAAPELTLRARDLATASFLPMHVYILAAVLYLILSYAVALAGRFVERVANRGRISNRGPERDQTGRRWRLPKVPSVTFGDATVPNSHLAQERRGDVPYSSR